MWYEHNLDFRPAFSKSTLEARERLAGFAGYVGRVVRKYLRNDADAEHATQEALFKVFMNLGSLR
jgi:DNA-directed RNA polymerase specialized sigma24 family protein